MYSTDVFCAVLKPPREELKYPITALGHCEHVVDTALKGHPELAADHLLIADLRGRLVDALGSIIRRLNLKLISSKLSPNEHHEEETRKIWLRQRSYEVLIEISLNIVGMESQRAGFTKSEVREALKQIIHTLEEWESLEIREGAEVPVAKAVITKFLANMKKVMHGQGMVAKISEEIERSVVEGRSAASFVEASKDAIQSNIYYQMVIKGLCKFGNDYALGLRWLRHLGLVQVSTNPVLAAIAYEDDPKIWDEFREVAKQHKEWAEDPDRFGDEIAMQATMVALWPNLAVFRPIALLSRFHDGMVSYQLNPNVASSLEESVEDALKIYSVAEEFLRGYDAYLAWGCRNIDDIGRPNIVFKVAGGYPAAISITTTLNSMGIGTNNTVTYTVAQETTLIMAAMKGIAEAVKRGIRPTQVYETNMGGRLESHLRDLEAEKLLSDALKMVEDREGLLRRLAEGLGAKSELSKSAPLEEKVRAICGYRYLKKLTHPDFVEAAASAKVRGKTKEENLAFLARLENDVGFSGTFVAHRVYCIFFSHENRPKWVLHLQKEFDLSRIEAEQVIDKIDVLPASKRKPADTFLTLAGRNMTNTEFPNHQWEVAQASEQDDFNLDDYRNAIMREPNSDIVQRLLELEDFRRAYELTPELIRDLKEVGIEGDFRSGGLRVEDWPSFGSVAKTMNEFRIAYENFKIRATEIVRGIVEDEP